MNIDVSKINPVANCALVKFVEKENQINDSEIYGIGVVVRDSDAKYATGDVLIYKTAGSLRLIDTGMAGGHCDLVPYEAILATYKGKLD